MNILFKKTFWFKLKLIIFSQIKPLHKKKCQSREKRRETILIKGLNLCCSKANLKTQIALFLSGGKLTMSNKKNVLYLYESIIQPMRKSIQSKKSPQIKMRREKQNFFYCAIKTHFFFTSFGLFGHAKGRRPTHR